MSLGQGGACGRVDHCRSLYLRLSAANPQEEALQVLSHRDIEERTWQLTGCLRTMSRSNLKIRPRQGGFMYELAQGILRSLSDLRLQRAPEAPEDLNSPTTPKDKVVYGAAYPPEMAEVMMQQELMKRSSHGEGGLTTFSWIRAITDAPTESRLKQLAMNLLGCVKVCCCRGESAGASQKFAAEKGEGVTEGTSAEMQNDEHVASLGQSVAAIRPTGNLDQEEAEPRETVNNNGKYQRRKQKFDQVLGAAVIDLGALQGLCWSGCPAEHRAVTWRLLLRYMPGEVATLESSVSRCAGNAERREDKMNRLRLEYVDAVVHYFDKYDPEKASVSPLPTSCRILD
eukprot:767257-Hanusia_phi.AAC.2